MDGKGDGARCKGKVDARVVAVVRLEGGLVVR